ncbi:MAG: hypothetical protein KJ626_11615 [Verrucomicrobia bacterium]|nr:hypothetical protein [Verrucomicrobiota bacterium]
MFLGTGNTTPLPSPLGAGAEHDATYARREVRRLQVEVEKLLMITEALWSMVQEQHDYADAELFKRVAEIDLRDGQLDGKVAPTAANDCPHCGRKLWKNRALCIYCGKPVEQDLFQR